MGAGAAQTPLNRKELGWGTTPICGLIDAHFKFVLLAQGGEMLYPKRVLQKLFPEHFWGNILVTLTAMALASCGVAVAAQRCPRAPARQT